MTGAEVRAALAEIGMTQRAFAARFALSEVVVSRWVNDVRPVPPWVPGVLMLLRESITSDETVELIARALLDARERRLSFSIGSTPAAWETVPQWHAELFADARTAIEAMRESITARPLRPRPAARVPVQR